MGTQAPIRLSAVEESILVWERASVPWAIEYGLSVPTLDLDRLRAAWNAALTVHEMGSWMLSATRPDGLSWVASDAPPDIGPLRVVRCDDDRALRDLRDGLLDTPAVVGHVPLVRAVVARCPGHDQLLVSHSHVFSDGIGGLRLLRSVARAYSGAPDPAPPVDVATARRTLLRRSPAGMAGLVGRWADGLRLAATAAQPRARVAGQGGGGVGFGLVVRSVDAREVAVARRRVGASFDAHLVAALHVTIDRWNRAHGDPDACVGVAFGVNLRPAAWARDVVANLAAFVSVVTEPGQRDDVGAAVAAVEADMEPARRAERARMVVEAARVASAAPLSVRQRLLAAVPEDRFDSIAVSNLGAVDDPPAFGGPGGELWVSAPAVPQAGISVVVITTGHELRITTAFRRERFDDEGALAFTDALAGCLLGG